MPCYISEANASIFTLEDMFHGKLKNYHESKTIQKLHRNPVIFSNNFRNYFSKTLL